MNRLGTSTANPRKLERSGKIPKLWRVWCLFCACFGEMFMVQQQDPSASAACRHTAIAECIADSMAAKGWACEFLFRVKGNKFQQNYI